MSYVIVYLIISFDCSLALRVFLFWKRNFTFHHVRCLSMSSCVLWELPNFYYRLPSFAWRPMPTCWQIYLSLATWSPTAWSIWPHSVEYGKIFMGWPIHWNPVYKGLFENNFFWYSPNYYKYKHYRIQKMNFVIYIGEIHFIWA